MYKICQYYKIIPSTIIVKGNSAVYNSINMITLFVFLVFFGLHLIDFNMPFAICVFVIFVSLWLTLLFYLNNSISLKIDNENLLLADMIDTNVEMMIKNFKNENEKIMAVKHDIKNHLQIIMAKNDLESIKKYISDLYNDIAYVSVFNELSNISIIDVILNLKKVQYPFVHFLYEINIDYIDINEKHFSTILFNLIDNACQNVDRDNPNVNIEILKEHSMFIITVTNTINKNLELKHENREGHGYGLKIVKYYTEKYNGKFSIERFDNIVVAQVIIKIDI